MKIVSIEATTHRVPAKVPLLDEPVFREIVFVRIHTDAGITGYGLTGPTQRFAVRELIRKEISPLLGVGVESALGCVQMVCCRDP